MTDPPLEELIAAVDAGAGDATRLERLAGAADLAHGLRARADALLDHFVQDAREADCSWTEIGCALGVSKQAAQQRFVALGSPPAGAPPFGLRGPSADTFIAAVREARELGHHYVLPEHMVLGLFSQPEELAALALTDLGVSPDAVRARITERLGTGTPRPTGSLGVAPQTKRLLELANAFAKRLDHRCARTEHILLAAVAPRLRSPAATLLSQCGAEAEQVRDQLAEMLLLEAPELAARLKQRWPLATFHMRHV